MYQDYRRQLEKKKREQILRRRKRRIQRRRFILSVFTVFFVVILYGFFSLTRFFYVQAREYFDKQSKSSEYQQTSRVKLPKKIILDAGHGGKDIGTKSSSVFEKDLNLQITRIVKEKLENENFEVYMTRMDDSTISINQRIAFCARQTASSFVSIHMNSNPDTSIHGTTVIIPKNHHMEESLALARQIQDALHEKMDIQREPYQDNRNLGMLKFTTMPAVLVEVGFMSNKQDEVYITKNKEQIAQKIVDGIIEYYQ